MPVAIRSRTFRFRNDDGSEAAASWKAAQGTNIELQAGVTFRLRFEIDDTGTTSASDSFLVQKNKNGGGWVTVTTSSADVKLVSSGYVTDDTATTGQITGGPVTFTAGRVDSTGASSSASLLGSSGNRTEYEYCLQVVDANVSSRDTIQFRVIRSGGTAATMTLTPSLTVNKTYTKTGIGYSPKSGGGVASFPYVKSGGPKGYPVDDFNDNSINTVLWTKSEPANTQVLEQNQDLEIVVTNVGNHGGGYVITNEAYDFSNSEVIVYFSQVYPGESGTEMQFQLRVDGTHYYAVYRESLSGFQCFYRKGGSDVQVGSNYSDTADKWWRIRFDATTVYFDHSPDGGSWTNLGSVSLATATVSPTKLYVRLLGQNWNGIPASPRTYIFDYLNTTGEIRTRQVRTGGGTSEKSTVSTPQTYEKAGIAISDFTGSGASVIEYTETGIGESPKVVSGVAQKKAEYVKTGIGIRAFPRLYQGAWIDGDVYSIGSLDAPWSYNVGGGSWDLFEEHAGKQVAIVHFGQPNPWAGLSYVPGLSDYCRARGAIPMVDVSTGTTLLTDIASGVYDSDIQTWADTIATYGKPILYRWNWEMNGSWFNWGAQAASNPADYVNAWRRFKDICDSRGATNLTWVWCPNTVFSGSTALTDLYPGDDYVDWMGIDGYNKGTNPNYTDIWRTFTTLFDATYDELVAISNKPILIGEIGCSEYGGDKAAWMADMFSQIENNYPQIFALVWFNWNDLEGTQSSRMDWPIESSTNATNAWKTGVEKQSWSRNLYGSLSTTKVWKPTEIRKLGAKAVVFVETGAGVSVRGGGGVSEARRTFIKSGTGISEFAGSGASQSVKTYIKTGSGISSRVASGAKASLLARAGIGISVFAANGPDSVVSVEGGIGLSPRAGSGSDALSVADTGIAVATATGQGAKAVLWQDTGSGISAFIASGIDAATQNRTGISIAEHAGSGVSQKNTQAITYEKAGTGISEKTASGAKGVVFSETGNTISVRAVAGQDAITWAETGNAVSVFVSSGAKVLVNAEAGIAVSIFTAAGAKAVVWTETGIAVSAFAASGSKQVVTQNIYEKTGAAISERIGNGVDAIIYAKTGIGVSSFSGSGYRGTSRVAIYFPMSTGYATGSFSNPLNVNADDDNYATVGVAYNGGVQEEWWGNWGLDALIPAGSRISSVEVVVGAKSSVLNVGKIGVRGTTGGVNKPTSFVLNNITNFEQQFTIDITSTGWTRAQLLDGQFEVDIEFTPPASGTYIGSLDYIQLIVDYIPPVTKVGIGISPRSGSGVDAIVETKSGIAISERVASGIETAIKGTTYQKTGIAISAHAGQGVDALAFARTGITVSVRAISGTDTVIYSESGNGISEKSILGSNTKAVSRTGIAIAARTVSGVDVSIISRTGIVISVFTGRGADQTTRSRVGISITSRSVFGSKNMVYVDTGVGIAVFVASGWAVAGAAIVKFGTAISARVSGGRPTINVSRSGISYSQRATTGTDAITFSNTGITQSGREGSGSNRQTYAERGTGISSFLTAGAKAVIFSETGKGISFFGGGSNRATTRNKFGLSISIHMGRGSDQVFWIESGLGILERVVSGRETLSGHTSVRGIGISSKVASGTNEKIVSRTGRAKAVLTGSGYFDIEYGRSGMAIVQFGGGGVYAYLVRHGDKKMLLGNGKPPRITGSISVKPHLYSSKESPDILSTEV